MDFKKILIKNNVLFFYFFGAFVFGFVGFFVGFLNTLRNRDKISTFFGMFVLKKTLTVNIWNSALD